MKNRWIALSLCLGIFAAGLLPMNAQAAKKNSQVLQYQELNHTDFIGRVSYYYDQEARCVREVWEDHDETEPVKIVEYAYSENDTPKTKQVHREDVLIEETKFDMTREIC